MSQMNTTKTITLARLLPVVAMLVAVLFTAPAHATAPGILGGAPTAAAVSFNLTAQDAFINQPDGRMLYSWGYGCNSTPAGGFAPAAIAAGAGDGQAKCPSMQIPGPTLIVTEGQTVSVTLTNNLPAGAGNTSILFPGFQLNAFTTGVPGLLTQEAIPGGSVTYSFTATTPGTRGYYSGTQGDLQVEMGLYGTIIVLPAHVPGNCTANAGFAGANAAAETTSTETDFRLASSAYDHASSCYDREYLFQFSEMDPKIHRQAEEQITDIKNCVQAAVVGVTCPTLQVVTEDYHPTYFLINGRSMPDDMDPNYASAYPHQPYNGNPHMHPGELVLLRIVGQGRWQHPFHEHGNHVRILARDGNMILSPDLAGLAGPLLFTTTTTPGLAMDGIFYWTGKGLNWDVFGHGYSGDTSVCTPDSNGYFTSDPNASNYYEWCADHKVALETHPFGDVVGGGPATLPDPNILTNGPWYGGSPYLGPDATIRAVGANGTTPPSGTVANPPSSEAGFAYMWHSHNEREITTDNAFPGGMMMMMLVDPRAFPINESN
jgi:FtsP/CotA-like multicopper oxidase with cupredoxin domain